MKTLVIALWVCGSSIAYAQDGASNHGCGVELQKAETAKSSVIQADLPENASDRSLDYFRAILTGEYIANVTSYASCLAEAATDQTHLLCADQKANLDQAQSEMDATSDDPADYNDASMALDLKRASSANAYLACLSGK